MEKLKKTGVVISVLMMFVLALSVLNAKPGDAKSKKKPASGQKTIGKSKNKKNPVKKTKDSYEVVEYDKLSENPEQYGSKKICLEGILEDNGEYIILLNQDFRKMLVLFSGTEGDLKPYKFSKSPKTRFVEVKGIFYPDSGNLQEPASKDHKLIVSKLEFFSDYKFYTFLKFKYYNFNQLISNIAKYDKKMLMLDGQYISGSSQFIMDDGKYPIFINRIVEKVMQLSEPEEEQAGKIYQVRVFCRFYHYPGSIGDSKEFKSAIDVFRMEIKGKL